VIGNSGGGTIALFTSAIDMRVKATIPASYFNTFRDSVYSIYHCPDNFIPGILQWFEMPDLVGLVAPRYLFVQQGERDPIFPLKGFREATAKAEEIYRVFGVPERIGSHVYPGGHLWNGSMAIPWLVKVLRD